jgi:WD40 repeat protein
MNERASTPQFEEKVRQSFGVPEIRTEFVDQVYDDLMRRAVAKSRKSRPFFGLRPAWTFALAIISLMIIGTLVIGPQRVYAAVLHLFGYMPGVGIVDQSSPIRILAEPVSISRDGITVSVNQAVLTGTETRIDFGVSGVTLSAYPKDEVVSGCIDSPYLLLPDGTKTGISAPIPAHVNEATLMIPCIFNTLPGTVPLNWELPIRFIAAPPNLTILPVIDVTPQEMVTPTMNGSNQTTETPSTIITTAPPQASVSVDKIIETEDGYILLGAVRPHLPEGSWLQITGAAILRDADGKKVSYSFPNDVQPLDDSSMGQGGSAWVMQIKGAGVKFPLTISFSGVVISKVDPQASAKITIDVGMSPQPEQVWEVNQGVQLAGQTVRLISVTAMSDGYSFQIDPGKNLSGVSVQIEGHSANGGGGGGGWQGIFTSSLVYSDLPKGELTVVFSNPLSASPTETWQGQWQPETVREFPSITSSSNMCLNASSFQALPLLPAGLDGKVVLTQVNPKMQILLAGMDGGQQQVIATDSGRAALTQDGMRLAYPTAEGIAIYDLTSGDAIRVSGMFGRDLHWSPDGSQIASVNVGDSFGIFITGSDGKNSRQLSNLGYESIAGWSPDGSTLYYAIPGSGGNGFLLRAVEASTGNTQDLFVLENSSRKAPLPAVSPDGKWIAYRASDNSSLYIQGMDGSPARLVLDNPATAMNGIAWEKESHLLGVSLMTPELQDGEIILIAPDSCEIYRLPGLSGELDGVLIP